MNIITKPPSVHISSNNNYLDYNGSKSTVS